MEYAETVLEGISVSSILTTPASAKILMIATYIIGGIGVFFGFLYLSGGSGLELSALLAVGATGVISFVRHALFNRADAVNGGWDYGVVNKFQIEVGIANLAWGVFAILAVVLGWGVSAIGASFLISGLYFLGVALFIVVARDFKNRKITGFIGILSWAVVMLWLGIGILA